MDPGGLISAASPNRRDVESIRVGHTPSGLSLLGTPIVYIPTQGREIDRSPPD